MGLSGYRGNRMSYSGVNSKEISEGLAARLEYLDKEVEYWSEQLEILKKDRDRVLVQIDCDHDWRGSESFAQGCDKCEKCGYEWWY